MPERVSRWLLTSTPVAYLVTVLGDSSHNNREACSTVVPLRADEKPSGFPVATHDVFH